MRGRAEAILQSTCNSARSECGVLRALHSTPAISCRMQAVGSRMITSIPGSREWRAAGYLLVMFFLFTATIPSANAAPVSQTAPTTTLPPFSGTSDLTFLQPPDRAPHRATRDLGSFHETSSWSVADPSHFRADVQTVSPAFDSDRQTFVVNGTTLLWYDSSLNRAIRQPVSQIPDLRLLGEFQGGTVVALDQMRGLGVVDYYTSHGGKGRVVGQDEIIGRTADVVEVGPIVQHLTITCSSKQSCKTKQVGFGTERVWFDHQLGIVLQVEQHGVLAASGLPRNLVYRVTSLTVGHGASAGDLGYQPPVPVTAPPSPSRGTPVASKRLSLTIPAGLARFQPPDHFVLKGQVPTNSPLTGKPFSFAALFTRSHHFLYVRERIRADGLPPELRPGVPVQFVGCQVWTGRYPDGVRWLALQHRHVSVLAASNTLSRAALRNWAASSICNRPISR